MLILSLAFDNRRNIYACIHFNFKCDIIDIILPFFNLPLRLINKNHRIHI